MKHLKSHSLYFLFYHHRKVRRYIFSSVTTLYASLTTPHSPSFPVHTDTGSRHRQQCHLHIIRDDLLHILLQVFDLPLLSLAPFSCSFCSFDDCSLRSHTPFLSSPGAPSHRSLLCPFSFHSFFPTNKNGTLLSVQIQNQ